MVQMSFGPEECQLGASVLLNVGEQSQDQELSDSVPGIWYDVFQLDIVSNSGEDLQFNSNGNIPTW